MTTQAPAIKSSCARPLAGNTAADKTQLMVDRSASSVGAAGGDIAFCAMRTFSTAGPAVKFIDITYAARAGAKF